MTDLLTMIRTVDPNDRIEFLGVWNGKVKIVIYVKEVDNWQEYPDGDFDIGGELTEWQPLPKPPKQTERNGDEV